MSGLSLDHVGIAVADLDKAAAQFQRLGFQLTPRGYHTLPPPSPGAARPLVGTGNNCAMLRRGYLELIGVTDPVYQGRLRADIARYEGLHVIAFGSEDAAATAGALRQAGLEVTGPRPLERPIEEQLAKFEIVDFVAPALPEAHFFAIRHGTPDLLWKPDLLTHPNGVVSLDALTIAVADPAEFAGRLGRFLSATPVAEDGLLLKLSPGHVRIVDGAWLAAHLPDKTPALPYVAGLGLGVADLAKTADLLTKNAIPFRRKGGALLVAPTDACGAFLEFRQAQS